MAMATQQPVPYVSSSRGSLKPLVDFTNAFASAAVAALPYALAELKSGLSDPLDGLACLQTLTSLQDSPVTGIILWFLIF